MIARSLAFERRIPSYSRNELCCKLSGLTIVVERAYFCGELYKPVLWKSL